MGRFITNQNEIKDGITQNNWKVAFSQRELTESDALEALVVVFGAIYTDQPEAIFAYLEGLLEESIAGLEAAIGQTLASEVRSEAEAFAIPLIKQFLSG